MATRTRSTVKGSNNSRTASKAQPKVSRPKFAQAKASAPVQLALASGASEARGAARAQPSEDTASRKSQKGQRTRERLVEAAKEIFEEHGFLNARVADIVERAEQAHGSFYYYFDSKEEVFRELATTVDEQLFAPLDDVVLKDTKNWPEPRDRIREATRRYLDSFRKNARMIDQIRQVASYDPEVKALTLARHKRNTERVANTIRQLQRRKMADTKLDPLVAATALGALTQRFAELWFVSEVVDITFEQGVEQLTRIYENALRITQLEKRT
jgi:AcrR family transcriptional regulator